MFDAVPDSPDLRRVLSLPRRRVDFQAAQAMADRLTPLFALHPEARLRPWQGQALWEIAQNRGAFLGLPVGTGKTLISLLAAQVLGAQRPWLIVPGSVKDDYGAVLAKYAALWRVLPPPPIYTFEELTQEGKVGLLEHVRPDTIIVDEADRLRNQNSVTMRIGRYINAYPSTSVVVMSGSLGRKSIRDYSHLLTWSLKLGAPVPLSQEQLELWAGAIDLNPAGGVRMGGGCLALWLGATTTAELRAAWSERLNETPGVLLVEDEECDQPLSVDMWYAPLDPVLEEHFGVLRDRKVSPDGWDVSDPLSMMRTASQVGCGVHYVPNPRPPFEWAEARSDFCKFVRARIEDSQGSTRPLDTDGAVASAFRKHPTVARWRAIKPTFEWNAEARWLSGSVVLEAAKWVQKTGGLVWCEHTAVCEAIAHVAQVPYFGKKGRDRAGRPIEGYPGGCVVSVKANKRMRNLQHDHYRNLVIGWAPSAEEAEQLFGRTHRFGQERPVQVEIMCTCRDTLGAFNKSWLEALFVQESMKLTQKLLRANVTRPMLDAVRSHTHRFGGK